MPVRESKIEGQFRDMVRARGGIALKLIPTIAGIPDRLILWPGGLMTLVEMKTKTGKRSAIQIHRHRQLAALGHPVVTLSGEEEMVAWLDDFTLGTLGPSTPPVAPS